MGITRILFATRKAVLGSSHYLGALLKGLSARGHECHLMLRPGPSLPYLRSLSSGCGRLSALPPVAHLQARWMLAQVRPDVANVMLTSATVPLVRECLRAGVPVVATLLAPPNFTGCLPDMERCASLVVLNHSNLDRCHQQYPSLTPIAHLSGKLVDRQRFRPGKKRQVGEFRLGCVGRLSQSKGERVLQTLQAAWLLRDEIPELSVTVVGNGTRLQEVRRLAAKLNRQSGRQMVSVCGGVAWPEEIIRDMDLVVAAGFSAIEALACHCQVIGMGFKGLDGLVGPENLDGALAANFGDSVGREVATPEAIAGEIRQAYARRAEPKDWIEQAFTGALDPGAVLDDLERLLLTAAGIGEP